MEKEDYSNQTINDAYEAIEIADQILTELFKKDICLNVSQAALGNAWIRLLIALRWKKEEFLNLAKEIAEINWEEKNNKK